MELSSVRAVIASSARFYLVILVTASACMGYVTIEDTVIIILTTSIDYAI